MIKQILASKILVLDGAMGTALQAMDLKASDFGGAELEGCNENLILTRPDVISQIHEQYLRSGADIVETNTFGATPMVLDEYGLGAKAFEINKKAAEIAKSCCQKYSTPEKPRFVAGSIGPTTKALSVTGGTTFKDLVDNFYIQVKGLIDGGADYLLIETAQDSRNIKAAIFAIEKLETERGAQYAVAISGTVETMGTMLAGQAVDALLASVMHRDLLYIGLNCATGPEFMTDHIRTLAKLSPFPVACVPNAGLPDEDGKYLETPEMMARTLTHFMDQGWINIVGGCCGTNYQHISAFAKVAEGKKPRTLPKPTQSWLSGIEFLEITDDMRPVIVGERTNVIGSKKFRDMITAEKFEEAADIARAQVKSGAQIVDICLSNPDRNEIQDLNRFMEKVIKVTKVPLMIDSTDEKVIELALTYCQGKSIINSINLEDGEERFEKVVPLARRYGAALVVGTIDEDPENGMAVTRERKLEIAKRSFDLLTQKYKILPQDIYFDPLVFPCATGDEKYKTSAPETIEGLRLIKKHFPLCKTVLGVSNVSFGLPAAGREVLNSVFLHHCVQAGLDLAIVNSEKLERYASLPQEEIELANNLLFHRHVEGSEDPITAFTNKFREKRVKNTGDRLLTPVQERLSKAIVEGTKEFLIEDLNEVLKEMKPLNIVNGPLMKGMDEVGRLFNDNKLIVAEVLQSAEVMKAAVAHLEKFMEKAETHARGKMVLATVKGDVHDIGKNLVDIILTNNGYEIINLGIKINPEVLIDAVKKHKPDMIGLSGLLVKSAQQMITTAEDLKNVGIHTPILVGGAALSRNFTEKRIQAAYDGPVLYASDAMNGLDLANQVTDPAKFEILKKECLNKKELHKNATQTETSPKREAIHVDRSPEVSILDEVPQMPDLGRHVLNVAPVEQIWKFINPQMLYGRHLGVKGSLVKRIALAEHDHHEAMKLKNEEPSTYNIFMNVQDIKKEFAASNVFLPRAVYQFFKAQGQGQNINILNPNNEVIKTFCFGRQKKAPYLCLADYVHPDPKKNDTICMLAVTAGNRVREVATKMKDQGDYLRSHILQALALETAEGYAEYMHGFVRAQWGFPDSPTLTLMEKFQAKYRGKRYSFGYPACPNLEDQKPLFDLLRPEDIGIELTDGFMMDPEASVTAVVFHHPQAIYFGIGQDDGNI
ncbi:MAG: methionine synthase [Oligoflexia bacterium]|nr:MAG: methionine synthase [Oligoflexia bacterium]